MPTGTVSATTKYIVRSITGLIILVFGLIALVLEVNITEDLTSLLMILYGGGQLADGFLTTRVIRNNGG